MRRGEGITNDAFRARAERLRADPSFQRLADRYSDDPDFRREVNSGLSVGGKADALNEAYQSFRAPEKERVAAREPEPQPEARQLRFAPA